ncbi:MAG: hypothetical protein ACK42H_03475, partial [Planctomycetota bacterium]
MKLVYFHFSAYDPSMTTPDDSLLASIFEERAEYLSQTELSKWTVESAQDARVLTKLKGPGAKLLSGPRGSGKSSYLRRAYFEMLE